MRSIRILPVLGCIVIGLMVNVGNAYAGCCQDAKKAGKACDHACCVAAAKAKKSCEKCNPKKVKTEKKEEKK